MDFGFEELDIWKKARVLKLEISSLVKSFAVEERFRLTDQLIRSSRSINALISEGHGRYTYPDQIHFCIQARGSLTEPVNHLIDTFDEGYISAEQLLLFKSKGKELERMINGYLSFLRKKRDEENK